MVSRHAEPKLARAGTDRIIYRCHIEREFAKTTLGSQRVEIGRFGTRWRRTHPLTSNSVVEPIGRVLNWALDEGLVEVNPAARLRKAGIRKPRERVLPEGDIRKFWNAIAAMETMTGESMLKGQHGRMLIAGHARNPAPAAPYRSAARRSVKDAVYNRYAYDKEKREAFELWGARVAEILNLPRVPEPPAHTRHRPKKDVAVTMR